MEIQVYTNIQISSVFIDIIILYFYMDQLYINTPSIRNLTARLEVCMSVGYKLWTKLFVGAFKNTFYKM